MEVVVQGLRKCGGGPGVSVVWKLAILLLLLLQLKLWGLSGGYGARITGWDAAQSVRQAVDQRLQTLEQRLESSVSRAMAQAQQQQAGGGSGGGLMSEGEDLVDREAQTDVSARLRQVAVDSPEAGQLRRLQYCDKYRNQTDPPAAWLEAWEPPPGKYLFPLCTNGRVSNRLVCMQSYVLLAALLNRTLVVPEKEPGPLGYEWRLIFDVHHARRCIGDARNITLLTLSEYRERAAAPGQAPADVVVEVQRVLHFKRFGASTARRLWPTSFPGGVKVVVPDKAEAVRSKVHSMADFFRVVGAAPESLISLGDLFWMVPFPGTPLRLFAEEDAFWAGVFPDMPRDFTARPTPPFRSLSCTLFMQPYAAILEAAKGMVSTVLGPDGFLAIHWRRADFLQFWNDDDCRQSGAARQLCRVQSIAATALCVREKAQANPQIRVVFAATDARPAELRALERMLAPAGLVVITDPSAFAVRWTWAERWLTEKLGDSPLAVATLDKVVCAMATVFMGTLHSTFSQEIVSMRAALGTLSCQDQDLCRLFPHSPKPLPFFNETNFFRQPF